jgi:hypothetical protein
MNKIIANNKPILFDIIFLLKIQWVTVNYIVFIVTLTLEGKKTTRFS